MTKGIFHDAVEHLEDVRLSETVVDPATSKLIQAHLFDDTSPDCTRAMPAETANEASEQQQSFNESE